MVLPAKTVFCDWPSLHTYITESSTLSAVSKITVESADFVGSNHLDWDHVHPDLSGGSSGVSVALYGIIGSESFCALHKNLKAAKSDDVSMYTVRHAYTGLSAPSTRQLPTYIHTYIYIHTYSYSFILLTICAYIHTYIHAYIHT